MDSQSAAAAARRPKAVIVGGSIAGLCSAHALIAAGWEVKIIEKSAAPPAASPTGAGLAVEPQAHEIIAGWISDPDAFRRISLPFHTELHHAVDSETKERRVLARDDDLNYRFAYWTDLHSIILEKLPSGITLWGHRFLSLCISGDGEPPAVTARTLVLRTGEIVEVVADLLVAADGCLSSVRQHFLPDHRLRYSGYSAWRGVFDFLKSEDSGVIVDLRRAYPELGHCVYYDMVGEAHCVLFELKNKKFNWVWYFNRPEPNIQGNSVTMKVSDEMIEELHESAGKIWGPELAKLMKETEEPFINVIYDSDPLPRLFWDNVVLVGDAAHPTTPHCSRSTNMSILDAQSLGSCLRKWGPENLTAALEEFQTFRLPAVSKQVLHSRLIGRLKQGLAIDSQKKFRLETATAEDCEKLKLNKLPFYHGVPLPS